MGTPETEKIRHSAVRFRIHRERGQFPVAFYRSLPLEVREQSRAGRLKPKTQPQTVAF